MSSRTLYRTDIYAIVFRYHTRQEPGAISRSRLFLMSKANARVRGDPKLGRFAKLGKAGFLVLLFIFPAKLISKAYTPGSGICPLAIPV